MFSGYSWNEWGSIGHEERAKSVAHYRLHHVIELHQHDAVKKAQNRRRLSG